MMYQRRWLAVAVVALGVLSLGFYGITQAAGHTAGKGPGDALALPDGWQTLESGRQIWYAFDYRGDKSEFLVRLTGSPAGSAAFAVWSPTDVERWSRGYAADPSGRGSTNAYAGDDLVWSGNSSYGGAWYVVVETSGPAQAWFSLKVSGSGVTGPLASSIPSSATVAGSLFTPAAVERQATPTAATVARQAAPAPAQQTALAFYNPRPATPTRPAQDPARALTLPEGPQTLEPGQHVWYAFQYFGDRSQIMMQLHADPPGSATFTVWSPDVLQRWAEGYFYTPTGRGTANEAYGGDLVWVGGNIIKGKWYVVVEQTGQGASTYTFQVSGSGIDRTLPPTPVPTPTYSLPMPTPGAYR